MESYCLKCEKNTENTNPRISSTSNNRTMIFSSVLYAIIKNQDLLKIKKQKDY